MMRTRKNAKDRIFLPEMAAVHVLLAATEASAAGLALGPPVQLWDDGETGSVLWGSWHGTCGPLPGQSDMIPISSGTAPSAITPSPTRRIAQFESYYILDGIRYQLLGHEPDDGTSGHPVYVHAGGAGDKLEDRDNPFSAPELRFTREMALRGYIAVISELPEAITDDAMSCNMLLNYSRQVFSWGGEGDNATSVTATLCRRPNANCSAGIAVHGLSVSGLLAQASPRFAPVTGLLTWSAGPYIGHGHGCCGRWSGNYSCCVEGGAVGGDTLACLTDGETSQFLERRRRRSTIGQGDPNYGDYTCYNWQLFPKLGQSDNMSSCVCDHSRPDSAINQSRLFTGYDCGPSTYDCIQPDGSGYYVATVEQVGGYAEHVLQAHNFHLQHGFINPDDPFEPPQWSINVHLNPNFISSREPWGLMPQITWLADIALEPVAR